MERRVVLRVSRIAIIRTTDKEKSPIDALCEMLAEQYADGVKIVDQDAVRLVLLLDSQKVSEESLKGAVLRLLADLYAINETEVSFSYPDAEAEGDGPSSEEKTADEAKTGASKKASNAAAESIADRIRRMRALMEEDQNEEEGEKDVPSEKGAASNTEADDTQEEKFDGKSAETQGEKTKKRSSRPALSPEVAEIKQRIDALVGCEAFKSLANELIAIAPQVIANKTISSFTYQSYIFSINDGYGLTTCLSLFTALIAALNLKSVSKRCPLMEEKLYAKTNNNTDPFASVYRILDNGTSDELQVLCIDISEWMNRTESGEFKEFLHALVRRMDRFIVVFRVPFVDKEVLAEIHHSLNDLVFVKTVSFPPLTNHEIRLCAEHELNKYGFRMASGAWKLFDLRITEEKSDGRFYGLNTIHKVVRELLYKKQLANAQKGKDSYLITKQDAAALCSDSPDDTLSAWDMLDSLVGAEGIRSRVEEIVSQIELAKKSDTLKSPCIHMRFVGNPGTGKTTVARIVGKILKEKGVLRIGGFYEYAGRDLVGRYIGETAPKTASICRDAYGSVLFIDEAYSLYRGPDNDKDFGKEALDTLIAEMENHRSDLMVIMAGYTDDMERLMQGNAGLASRMPYVIEFPNFTREELYQIFVSMVEKNFTCDDELLGAAREYFLSLPDELIQTKEFSNARFVRNLFERVWAKAAMRTQLEKKSTVVLTKDDFERSTADKEFRIIMKKKTRIGFVE